MTERPLPMNQHSAVIILCFNMERVLVHLILCLILSKLVPMKQCSAHYQLVCCITLLHTWENHVEAPLHTLQHLCFSLDLAH